MNSTIRCVRLAVLCCVAYFQLAHWARIEILSQQSSVATIVSSLDREGVNCEGVSVNFAAPDYLVVVESSKKRTGATSLKIVGAAKGWDLSSHRFVEASFSNTGSVPLKVAFWVVGSCSWDTPVESFELSPGEKMLCSVDLKQRWRGGQTTKFDAKEVKYFRVQTDLSEPGSQLSMSKIMARGNPIVPREEFEKKNREINRLVVPNMENKLPAAGLRVREQLPRFETTEVYHSLYLPTNWKSAEEAERRYPIIVEYSGNYWLSAPCYSLGRPESARIGYGMSQGQEYIWVNAPFVAKDGKGIAVSGWGDPDATADYAVEVVKHVCERYGGDPSAVVLTGFSRGAIACGFIGRRNEAVNDVWLAFHPCQHFDGDGWRGANYQDALNIRGPRIQGRSTFHTDNNNAKLKSMFETLGNPVRYELSGLGAHTDTMFLEDRPSTLAVRKWLHETVAEKPGTVEVTGRVTDSDSIGISGVRVQSGATHFDITDNDGRYRLQGLLPGQRRIIAIKADWSSSANRLVKTDLADVDFRVGKKSGQQNQK